MINQRSYSRFRNRAGFAILMLLVVVAILMILYFIDFSAVFRIDRQLIKSSALQNKPWLEEDRILPVDALADLPKPPKPQLDEPVEIRAAVTRNAEQRGELKLEFTTKGVVTGSWQYKYSHENQDYAFEANIAGNIDVSKTFTKKKQADKSLLYFITKGQYSQITYNRKTGRAKTEEGLAYVTGWLWPDYTAKGLITITTDKTWAADYNWQSF